MVEVLELDYSPLVIKVIGIGDGAGNALNCMIGNRRGSGYSANSAGDRRIDRAGYNPPILF